MAVYWCLANGYIREDNEFLVGCSSFYSLVSKKRLCDLCKMIKMSEKFLKYDENWKGLEISDNVCNAIFSSNLPLVENDIIHSFDHIIGFFLKKPIIICLTPLIFKV